MAVTTPGKPGVESKVSAATAGAGVGAAGASAVAYALLTVLWPNLDETAKLGIAAAVPGVVAALAAFIAGYQAKHTYRLLPELPAAEAPVRAHKRRARPSDIDPNPDPPMDDLPGPPPDPSAKT